MALPIIRGVSSVAVRSGAKKMASTVTRAERRQRAAERLSKMDPSIRKNLSRKVSKSKTKKFAKSFGRKFLESYGITEKSFGDTSFSRFFTGTLGLFEPQSSANKQTNAPSVQMPALDTPSKIANDNSPTISSIISQLDAIARVAEKMANVVKSQQDLTKQQIVDAERVNKESVLETDRSIADQLDPGQGEVDISEQIASLSDAIENLSDAIDQLQQTQGTDTSSGIGDVNEDAGDLLKRRRRKKPAQRVPSRPRSAANDNVATRVLGEAANDNGAARLLADAANDNISHADDIARGAARSSKFGRVASVVGAGVRKSSQVATKLGGSVRAAIKKIAGPLIAKSVGRTAIKSIPLLGAIAGTGFAIGRLLEGDPVGAGLEFTSGLAGPITAIPLLTASIARDAYAGVYGVAPEQDPYVKERMAEITGEVKKLIGVELGQSVEVNKPNVSSLSTPAAPSVPTLTPSGPMSTPGSSSGPMPTPQTPSGPMSTPAAPSGPMSTPQTPSGPMSTPQNADATKVQNEAPVSDMSAADTEPPEKIANNIDSKANQISQKLDLAEGSTANRIEKAVRDSRDLISLSLESQRLDSPLVAVVNGSTSRPLPSQRPTIKTGARGIGNVPDPGYGGINPVLYAQMYA